MKAKRLISMLVLLCMTVGLVSAQVHAEEATSGSCGANATWLFDEASGTLTISGSGAMTDYQEWNLPPWAIFKDNITSVVIEPGITAIGAHNFLDLEVLEHVSLPEGLESIGIRAFRGCAALKSVDFPTTLTRIELSAFGGCKSLTEIVIPEKCSMSQSVFSGCSALKRVTLPETIIQLQDALFRGCVSLESIVIPASVARIYYEAFAGCTGLKSVYFLGDAPEMAFSSVAEYDIFYNVEANIYYPRNNATYTESYMKDYSGKLTWIPYCAGQHSWGDWSETTAATCVREGEESRACNDCGEAETRKTGLGAHSLAKVKAVEATTEAEGNVEFYACTVCDKYFADADGKKEIADRASVILPKLDPPATEPAPTDPVETEPKPTEPAPTDPVGTEPAPTETAPTEPVQTEPTGSEPQPTQPGTTAPAGSQPEPTQSQTAAGTDAAGTDKPDGGNWGVAVAIAAVVLAGGAAAVLLVMKRKK